MTSTLVQPTSVDPPSRATMAPREWNDALPAAAAAAGAVAALAVGAIVAFQPLIPVALTAMGALTVVVWRRPHVAAYLIIATTPLVVGIDRGTLIPVLRPNEALTFFLIGVLTTRAAVARRAGQPLGRLRIHRIERGIIALAITSSIVPMAFMVLRGEAPTGDDIAYALVLWKYLAGYAVIRVTISTQEQIGRCLQLSLASAVIVGCLAILQSLGLFGVRQFLIHFWAPFGYTGALALPRGSSTLGLPAATADLLIFNLAILIGIVAWKRGLAAWHVVCGGVFVLGTLAAAEFSSALGLLIALIALAAVLRKMRMLLFLPFGAAIAVTVMWPVIHNRLVGFQSASGLPVSWVGRIRNLTTYFFPTLSSGSHPLFGVRPSARVPVSSQATGYVWIESGYVWLLWGGGIFLFGAFVYFVAVSTRFTLSVARPLDGWTSIAALAAFTGVVVVTVLMIFDPHITYRGSADLLFALLAMAVAGTASSNAPPGCAGEAPSQEARSTKPGNRPPSKRIMVFAGQGSGSGADSRGNQ